MSQPGRPYRVVVGLDETAGSHCALAEAFDIVERRPEAELHVLHVIDHHGARWPGLGEGTDSDEVQHARETLLRDVDALLSASANCPIVTLHVRGGDPALQLLFLAQDVDADLVAVGTHGRTGLQRLLLGSVAERVVRTAPCPVLVVRERVTAPA